MPIGESRRQANRIKRQEKITVVIGNPPYKEKAKGLGGWIESGSTGKEIQAPLRQWMPPPEWSVSAHAKHLRNLYVYFWRWATWKVFDDSEPEPIEGRSRDHKGIVCFITVAGFLNGPGFQKMRADLRWNADEIWVIDCSPEGPSARRADPHLPGRAAPCMHRHGASKHGCGLVPRQRQSRLPRPPARASRGEIRGTWRDRPGRRWVDGLFFGPARVLLPQISGGLGRVLPPLKIFLITTVPE